LRSETLPGSLELQKRKSLSYGRSVPVSTLEERLQHVYRSGGISDREQLARELLSHFGGREYGIRQFAPKRQRITTQSRLGEGTSPAQQIGRPGMARIDTAHANRDYARSMITGV
jgi:hypothetical protein